LELTVADSLAAANGSNGDVSQSPSLRRASRVASDGPPLPHVQLGGWEINLIPCQAEDFTSPLTENEDKNEDRVQRFTGMPGRFEEPAGVIDSPGLALGSAA
jgi:hypothetical protein